MTEVLIFFGMVTLIIGLISDPADVVPEDYEAAIKRCEQLSGVDHIEKYINGSIWITCKTGDQIKLPRK